MRNKNARPFCDDAEIQVYGKDATSLGRGHYNIKTMTKFQFKSIETTLQCQDDGKIMPM